MTLLYLTVFLLIVIILALLTISVDKYQYPYTGYDFPGIVRPGPSSDLCQDCQMKLSMSPYMNNNNIDCSQVCNLKLNF